MLNGKKVALITGIGGQDGSYLAEFLLEKGYYVRGITRRSSNPNTHRIDHLLERYNFSQDSETPLIVFYADLTDASSIHDILEKVKPDEIYNLAAQSHVGISFQNPLSTMDINALGPLRILEAIRQLKLDTKFYQASSSEMFGISAPPQNENTLFKPQSPYGVSKVAAFHMTQAYRRAYNLFACNGILFNHESPRRGINFVTRKITRELARIVVGDTNKIVLGNLDAKRDWGFSKEYIEAMWRILQHHEADDFVIATEETHTVREFLEEAFSLLGEDYQKYVQEDPRFRRPAEVPALLGDPTKSKNILKWEPKVKFKDLVKMMVVSDLKEWMEKKGIISVDPNSKNDESVYLEKAKELLKSRI